MGERENSQISEKHSLLRRRKQLLDIKLQLQKDVHFTQPCNFGSKFGTLSEEKVLSVADELQHKFTDLRFLQPLECHMLCGLRVVNYDKSKLVVQFRASYMQKILPEVYAINLSAENDGNYSVKKYHLPLSIKLKKLICQWTPLQHDNLKNFLMDVKQQINAFHHRQNQILQLKEWANNEKITLGVFHPLSFSYIIITVGMNDRLKLVNCSSVDLVLQYDSDCYLPTKIDIESSDLSEEDLVAAKEQFSAFKLYDLKEAFEISTFKKERFSLTNPDTIMEDVPNGNSTEEDNDALVDTSRTTSSVSVKEGNISGQSATTDSKKLAKEIMRSQVNKDNEVLGDKSSSSSSESVEERNITGAETDGVSEKLKNWRTRSQVKKDNEVLGDKSSSSSSESVVERNISGAETDGVSEKLKNWRTRSQVKKVSRPLSIVQEARKSKSKSTTKGKRNVALESKGSKVQTKKALKKLTGTYGNAPKKKKFRR